MSDIGSLPSVPSVTDCVIGQTAMGTGETDQGSPRDEGKCYSHLNHTIPSSQKVLDFDYSSLDYLEHNRQRESGCLRPKLASYAKHRGESIRGG